jgi:Flp pilus assembly protein TadD
VRGHLARREFAPARQILEAAAAGAPREVRPRQLLSHVLLQEGRDWAAAEQALRDVLEMAPDHAEARHNLEVLRHQQACAA